MTAIHKMAKAVLPEIAIDIAVALKQYRGVHGVTPNLLFPRTFNEKVVHRSLFDNRPILRRFADKYAVREYVTEKLGAHILPELYWVTEAPSTMPFGEFPEKFVVKPTHGAGWVRIVKDKTNFDADDLVKECHSWLSRNFYHQCRERVYKNIPPRILVEEFIDDGSEDAPVDYKFLVFHGRVEFITPVYDRFTAPRAYFLDRNWKVLETGLALNPQTAMDKTEKDVRPPKHLAELIEAAEILADGMDFVRADFYDTGDRIYFGELTTTPGAGLAKFSPDTFDEYLGSFW